MAEGQRAYLVMELLRGRTLRQELSKGGRLPSTRASEILRGVCAAVDAARQQRILHRDLKPENIFLVRAGSVETAKILDFGVVKPIAAADTTLTVGQTSPGVLVGTLTTCRPSNCAAKSRLRAGIYRRWRLLPMKCSRVPTPFLDLPHRLRTMPYLPDV
jgi:serine/threonine protein kinase